MIVKGLVEEVTIDGVPFKVDLVPTSNVKARPGYQMTPVYITVHNTGNPKAGADAQSHTEYLDRTEAYVSWHFTVDDQEIFQEIPINEVAWHAGDGANGEGNRKSVGIEIAENVDGDYKKSEENGIKLIAYLLGALKLNIEAVVPHQKWSGKYCPHRILDEGWDQFINRIKNYIGSKVQQPEAPASVQVSSWAKEAWDWAKETGINDGVGMKAYVTEEQVMVFLKRYHDFMEKNAGN